MFFRPTFCANCGEKIARTDWGLLTSRRFCQVCESEFKGQDLIPRVIVIGGILIGVFGFGSYLRSGVSADPKAARVVTRTAGADLAPAPERKPFADNRPNDANANARAIETQKAPPAASNIRKDTRPEIVDASERLYYCGARTKKGTPCSRKVKGNVRCFQHTGMPAMLSAEELKVK